MKTKRKGRSTLSISLPADMATLIDAVARREYRSRSELMREALRSYIRTSTSVVEPTKEELRAIDAGLREFERGEFSTLDQVVNEMDYSARSKGTKGIARSTKG